MKTMTPAQAEHQLISVADRFDEWRQTRPTRAEPIPQHLWEQAIALTAMFPLRRLAKIIYPFLLSMCYDWLYAEPNK